MSLIAVIAGLGNPENRAQRFKERDAQVKPAHDDAGGKG
jgi:hypothetical protein